MCFTVELSSSLLIKKIRKSITDISGVNALRGNTRSHPEHDGEDLSGRWSCIGDDAGEQVGAGSKKKNK